MLKVATPITLIFFVSILSCKKDCLEKDKCSPSTYSTSYVIEQTTPAATGTVYYIDADKGKKNNDGKSTETAFKNMEQLEEITFVAGDQILFKRGQYHFGEFRLEQSGTAADRIYITAYDSGDAPILKTTDSKDGKTIYLFNADYVTIQNLNVHGGTQAILLDGADYAIIEGCRIGENSNSGMRATGQYSETTGSNFGIVRHCLIYSGLSGNLGDMQSTDGIQLMDGASDWHIYQNEFKAWAHSAMSIKPIYTSLSCNNNVVENNLFECGDIDYMRAFDITGADNRAANNVFQNNIIRNQTVTSHLHGNSNIVAYNLFLGLKNSAASTQGWAIDMHVFIGNSGGVDRKEYVCYDNKVYNNLIYNYQSGIGIRALNSKDGTTNYVKDNDIVNNIFYNVGTAIDLDNEPTGFSISNNIFFNPSSAANLSYNYGSLNFSAFEALNGTNGHGILNNLSDNPLFANTSSEDFSLSTGSPAINAGIDVGLLFDYLGNSINGTPDIGPTEF